jgi:hypothetical protein
VHLAAGGGLDRDVERVRLLHDAGSLQIVRLRREGETVDPAAEPAELDLEVDLRRVERTLVPVGVDAKLGFDALLEDRDLQRKIAVFEQSAAVGAALEVGFFSLVGVIVVLRDLRGPLVAAGGERRSEGADRRGGRGPDASAHGAVSLRSAASPCDPARRARPASDW